MKQAKILIIDQEKYILNAIDNYIFNGNNNNDERGFPAFYCSIKKIQKNLLNKVINFNIDNIKYKGEFIDFGINIELESKKEIPERLHNKLRSCINYEGLKKSNDLIDLNGNLKYKYFYEIKLNNNF